MFPQKPHFGRNLSVDGFVVKRKLQKQNSANEYCRC